jgi:hypothetical protein
MAVHHGPLAALVVGASLLTALIFASGDAKRRWIARFPLRRARSKNLEAKRGNPAVWLVAHGDSKSQTVPILIRIASSVALAVVTAASFGVLSCLVGVSLIESVWHLLTILAVLTALPSMLCFIRNDSMERSITPAAVPVLLAAQSESAPRDLGILITSRKSLALVRGPG